MIHFAWIWAFILLPLPQVMRFVSPAKQRMDSALKVPFYDDVVNLGQATYQTAEARQKTRLMVYLLWVLLVLAVARPQWLGDPVALPVAGRDIMMAVDVSGSMELPDLAQNGKPATRLEVVKQAAGNFIDQREGDRLGLILFGTRAYVQTPLTFDRATVHTMLNEAEIGLAGKETAIGDALGLAIKRLRDLPQDKRIFLH